ncbi:MAG: hypothetical protein SGI71_02490 [Verrucomicrobiota bacterium]|nr:hypothetical protein [Verrucomicrobiota bacterium]
MFRHIHHALAQVHELRERILEKQRFKGYSGRARAICGTLALITAMIMSWPGFFGQPKAHVIGWGLTCFVAVLINFGALVYWFLFDPDTKRDVRKLKPVFDVMPSIFVGGVLTFIMLSNGHHQYLFGVWMSLYGLANLASRHVLPRAIVWIGFYYICAGTICLLAPPTNFTNPWPMGIVFFAGEWLGGMILHYDGEVPRNLSTFFYPTKLTNDEEEL